MLELLYLLVKYKCLENTVSPAMVFSKNSLKKLLIDPTAIDQVIPGEWRKEMLGDNLINWIRNINDLDLEINDGEVKLSLK